MSNKFSALRLPLFDPENGTVFQREALRILESLDLDKEISQKIFYKNLERITGRKLVS